MEDPERLQSFALSYLGEIHAEVQPADGVYTVTFPAGRRRKFGRQRRITFDPEKRQEHVEYVEPGSPLLKLLLLDAKAWGGLAAYPTDAYPPGTRLYTFEFRSYSSLKKRTRFLTAHLPPTGEPSLQEGIPTLPATPPSPTEEPLDVARLKDGLPLVLARVQEAGQHFSQDAVRESREGYAKSMDQVQHYFQGMRQETYLEEARIRRRLGEIQSKLYFTEDGLRERKLQLEQERLTRDLHTLKKRNLQRDETLDTERETHLEKQRRRHEPKLHIRLVAATLITQPPRGPLPPPVPVADPPAMPVALEPPAEPNRTV